MSAASKPHSRLDVALQYAREIYANTEDPDYVVGQGGARIVAREFIGLHEQLDAVDGTYRMVVIDDEHPDGFEYEQFPVGHDQTLWFTKEPSNVTRIELRFQKAKED